MSDNNVSVLSIVTNEKYLRSFLFLIQAGFLMRGPVGCSIREFLTVRCDMDEAYITERVQSVFLDGKPIDDIDAAIVLDGSYLSVSGAMPGLVGAVMRRGSPYASFRSTISYTGAGEKCAGGEGLVKVKYFNLIQREQGPALLKKGILVSPDQILSFFGMQDDEFRDALRSIMLDGSAVDGPGIMKKLKSSQELVFLSVRT